MTKLQTDNECKGLRRTGILNYEELASCPGIPSEERLWEGPVAVIECGEEIPCDPCEANCPRGAIHIGDVITSRPYLDSDRCVGCALCVSHCPGLAIFVVDLTREEGDKVTLPYEFLPLPKPGEIVHGMNREGEIVCDAQIVKVDTNTHNDRTAVVILLVPKGYGMEVRFFCEDEGKNDGEQG